MGIPAGTRARMLKDDGIPPTHETLARIMRVENVSLSWLLGADAAPFLVNRTRDDHETAQRLDDLLADEDSWRVVVLVDGDAAALVLHQPAQIQRGNKVVEYIAMEVIAGPFGERTFDVLKQRRYGRVQAVARIAPHDMRAIYAGQAGSYRILGDAKHDGLIDPAAKGDIDLSQAIDNITRHQLRVAESGTGGVPKPLMPLARWWPMLQDAERDAITTLLDPFIDKIANRARDQR